MAQQTETQDSGVLGVRLSSDLLARVEKYQRKVTKALPAGLSISRSDVLRICIEAGLDALEK